MLELSQEDTILLDKSNTKNRLKVTLTFAFASAWVPLLLLSFIGVASLQGWSLLTTPIILAVLFGHLFSFKFILRANSKLGASMRSCLLTLLVYLASALALGLIELMIQRDRWTDGTIAFGGQAVGESFLPLFLGIFSLIILSIFGSSAAAGAMIYSKNK